MNRSEFKDHSIYKRIILIIGLAIIAVAFYFLLRFTIPPGISIEKVLLHPENYLGRTITVRGVAVGMIFDSTLNECEPFECDCNSTHSNYLYIGSEQGENKGYGSFDSWLFINALECRGDECTMYCDRLVYKNGQTYTFTGKLEDGFMGELSLEDVNLNKSSRKVGLFWLPVSQFGGQIDVR